MREIGVAFDEAQGDGVRVAKDEVGDVASRGVPVVEPARIGRG